MFKKSLKPKLRTISYNNWSEALLLIVGGTIFCSLILYSIFTGAVSKSDHIILCGFIISVVFLLIGIWMFLKRKTTTAINENGWKYRVFQKVSKFQFVLITGLVKSVFLLFISLLYLVQKLPLGVLSIKEIMFIVIFYIVVTLWMGYIELSKYKSVNAN